MKASSNCIVDDLKVVASCDGKQVDIFGSKGIAAAVGRLLSAGSSTSAGSDSAGRTASAERASVEGSKGGHLILGHLLFGISQGEAP